METLSLYLLKSAAWLTGFAIVYMLFLQNERFFVLKRIYLISGIIISVLFPLITIHYKVEAVAQPVNQEVLVPVNISTVAVPGTVVQQGIDYKGILVILYLIGVVIVTTRMVIHFISIYKSIKSSHISDNGEARIVMAPEFHSSFSFFNYVFVNPSVSKEEVEQIMNHELVHVRQMHWLDLLLAEFTRTIQWVNPFAWIYTRFVRLNHEYLADEDALQRTSDPAIYKAALLNQMMRAPVFSLSNSFNYSLNKKRFDMMKKIITSPYRRLKVLFVLPVFAIVFYAFATPEYQYSDAPVSTTVNELTVYEAPAIQQNEVKGIVQDEKGNPLPGVLVIASITSGPTVNAQTGSDGWFYFADLKQDASLRFSKQGYKVQSLKPLFKTSMTIKMEKDPNYVSAPVVFVNASGNNVTPPSPPAPMPQSYQPPVVAVDGVITDKNPNQVTKDLGYNYGTMTMLTGAAATDKYGEKGANGVYDILTREKALSMGLNPPYPRLVPDDYPTFQGKPTSGFRDWVISQAKYPEAAKAAKVAGYASVSFTVQPDGTVDNVKSGSSSPNTQLLNEELIRVVKTSPKWDPPKNKNIKNPFTASISVKFKLPDIVSDEEEPFVVVEQMPLYPGGDTELLKFIGLNTRYPQTARDRNVQGRVIVRFCVSTDGNAEEISVLKGVDPALDEEAIRVVSMLKGFQPGYQGGKAVPVWYMVPITFALAPTPNQPQTNQP